VIDAQDFPQVNQYAWHFKADGGYAGSSMMIDTTSGKKHVALYQHNLIMGITDFKGKGQKESVDHINRCGRDNRRENLRYVSQTEQNRNRNQCERRITLPEDCGFTLADIPRNICYLPPEGLHGAGFSVEIRGIPELCGGPRAKYQWKSTRRAGISLRDKLRHAVHHLKGLVSQYPQLQDPQDQRDSLARSFNAILLKSRFAEATVKANLSIL